MAKQKLPKGVRRKSNGKFIADVCVNGVRKTATCETPEEAVNAQKLLKYELESLTIPIVKQSTEMGESSAAPSEVWTLGHACEYMFLTGWKKAKRLYNIQSKVKRMLEYFGTDIDIARITTKHVDEYKTHLEGKGLKAGSINVALSTLSTILHGALDREVLTKIPRFRRVKNEARRIRYLTEDEEVKILEYLNGQHEMQDIIICLLDTGMRVNELLNLTADNIDFTANIISLWKTKTNRLRSIPMTDRVVNILKKRYNNPNIFTLNYVRVYFAWDKMRKSFGEGSDFVLHILRHTCCSRLIQRGADVVKVMHWLGHTNLETTMRYTHLNADALNPLKELLNK